jgi:hypothetical protein
MANLYEINNAIMDCIDYETGEILDVERLNALQMEKQDKIESVALWIKNLSADAIAYKAEKDAFAEREKAALKKIESLKNWLSWALEGQKFSTWRCAVSFRKSEAVEIEDDCNLPQYLLNEKVTYTPNKTAIKEAIKAGEEIPGCKLVERMNPTIK